MGVLNRRAPPQPVPALGMAAGKRKLPIEVTKIPAGRGFSLADQAFGNPSQGSRDDAVIL